MTKRNLLQQLLDDRVVREADGWQRLEQRLEPSTTRSWWLVLVPAAAMVALAVWLVTPRVALPPSDAEQGLHLYLSRANEPAVEITLRSAE